MMASVAGKEESRNQVTQAESPASRQLDALMSDLSLLDERLKYAVENVRGQIPESADPAHRGLIIGEEDVDAWLSNLGSEQSPIPPPSGRFRPEGRLAILGAMFGLSLFEQAFVLTALAPEINLAYAGLYAYAQDDVTRKYATLDLAISLWCTSMEQRLKARTSLGGGAPLRRFLLMSLDESLNTHLSLLARGLHLDPRTGAFLLGSNEPDPSLGGSVRVLRPRAQDKVDGEGGLPEGQVRSLAQLIYRTFQGASSNPPADNSSSDRPQARGVAVWMRGADRQAKRATAQQLASLLGCSVVVVDLAALVSLGGDLRHLALRAQREARLQGGIILWEGADLISSRREETGTDVAGALVQALQTCPTCALFDVRTALPLQLQEHVPVDLHFEAPSNEMRRTLWERAFTNGTPLAPDVDLQLLTGAFRLTGEQIAAAADAARHSATWRSATGGALEGVQVTMRDLLAACRSQSNQNLGMLARKITARYTWDDLVLPTDRLSQLREMSYHIRYGPLVFEEWGFDRKLAGGKGLNVLFSGQPGTGKTMAAEVLATDLGLELYKIDLSSVVSKYIGETEKNLEKIFSEAQTSNAILFFDEADSLFGKRSSVKDSHDRYANIETSYLLQRMDEYDGIVILATNLRKNLDDAFVRRLHGAIEFPMPEEPDRLQIWERTFPHEAPLSPDVDLAFFAKRFKLAGGNIKNIILEAAFFAAEAGSDITMEHLVRATRREHQKMGKLITASDFGPYADLLGRDEGLEATAV